MANLGPALKPVGVDFFRPLVVLGLIAVFGLFILYAGGSTGVIALALPIALVALLWGVPLGVATVNGSRWPLILLTIVLIMFMDGSFRAKDCNDQSMDWQVLAKLFSWLAAGGVAVLNLPRVLPLLRQPHIALATAFVVLYPVSALWAADPFYALSSGVFHLFIFGFVLAMASHLGERGTITAVAIAMGVMVIPSLMISPFTPSFAGIGACSTGELDRVRGFTNHPVALASLSCKFIIVLLYMLERKWLPRAIGIGLVVATIVTILLTQSRMPPIALVGAVLLTFVIRQRIFGLATPFVALPLMLLTLVILALGIDQIITEDVLRMVSRSGRPEEILTLSGRSEIWAFVMRHVADAPILGHGQGAGPAILLTGFKGWALVHAHSMYLQTLLCFGLVGLALLIANLLVQYQLAIATRQTITLYVLTYMCLLGVTEVSIVFNLPDTNFMLWVVAVVFTLPWREQQTADAPAPASTPASTPAPAAQVPPAAASRAPA